MSQVHVIRPGLLTTVQDGGRWGWQESGVSVSGAMDPRAHRAANALVGNKPTAATLEITLRGPELEFEEDRTVALCGADFVVTVAGHAVASDAAFRVPCGARLRIGVPSRGSRVYLAIAGGIDVQPIFGSRATHLPSRLGGFEGRALAAGDVVPLGPSPASRRGPVVRAPAITLPRGHARLRILPGPQRERFALNALDELQSEPYTIQPASDRMGYRLEGPRIAHAVTTEMISDPSQLGALQIPASGQPILLMADRQTTGGYPKLAVVISADIGLAGQLAPGDTIAFAICTRQEALVALIAQERTLMALEQVEAGSKPGIEVKMGEFEQTLREAFGPHRIQVHAPLAPLTTFKVGGPADWLLETRASDEIVTAVDLACRFDVPVTLLGGGSNVLIGDGGVRGLVVRPRGGAVHTIDDRQVRADAALTINGLVRWTVLRGLAGLEVWAGTPGTVGGAIFGNAHFGGRLIGELVTEVRLVSRDGLVADVPASAMAFGYDRSRLQDSAEVLLSATFAVSRGEPEALRTAARQSLGYRKRTQPLDSPSAGCVFRNPEPGRDRVPDGLPWSAGALVDRAGLKGVAVGGARVSLAHGNFIVNEGHATAAEIRALIERCRTEVRDRLGVDLRDEIVLLGDFTRPS